MTAIQLLPLIAIFFLTSIISTVTGSTSLITVPVMFQFSIEPRTAIANIFSSLVATIYIYSAWGSRCPSPPGRRI